MPPLTLTSGSDLKRNLNKKTWIDFVWWSENFLITLQRLGTNKVLPLIRTKQDWLTQFQTLRTKPTNLHTRKEVPVCLHVNRVALHPRDFLSWGYNLPATL